MSEYRDRLKKIETDEKIVDTLIKVIELEERNITYKRPPRIIEQVMEIVEDKIDYGDK